MHYKISWLPKLIEYNPAISDIDEYIEEFKEMSHDEIMNCFLGEVQVDKKHLYLPFYEGDEDLKYGIYFKLR